ncbi:MAG: DNA-3-methyladenine glycosylase [Bdellovibrionia bacterium]
MSHANYSSVFIEDTGDPISAKQIVKTKRIGVDYSGPAAHLPLRFYLKDNAYISKK